VTNSPTRCVARIKHRDKDIVFGAGFLVSPGHVMTCAHMVNAALERKQLEPERPGADARVRLDFPLAPSDDLAAEVVEWCLPAIDAAVLRIEHPSDLQAPALYALETTDRTFRAFGFPRGFPQGRNEKGEIGGPVADGLLEVRPTGNHRYFVEQGFSGAPAFLLDARGEATTQIVGMVVATGPEPEARLAYLIPATQLERAWPLLAKPYRGLFAFGQADARWFHGRETFIELLAGKVAAKPVVAVVGASGSGKSSVVLAGLIPRLGARWMVASFRPDRRPLYELAYALAPLLEPGASASTRAMTARQWERELAADPKVIHDAARAMLDSAFGREQLLLIVDQFEELFTLVDDTTQRDSFVAVLEQLGQQTDPPPVRLVLTLRADFTGRTYDDRRLTDLLQDAKVDLGPMTASELALAIEQPARNLGVAFEDGLADEILAEVVKSPDLLPLMEFSLEQLWQQQAGRTVPRSGYQTMGGVEGALTSHAEKTVTDLTHKDPANGERVRRLLLRLTHVALPGEQGQDTRRPRSKDELGDELWAIAQHLADARLLVTDQDATTGAEVADIVHEALLRAWPRLVDWLDEDREFLAWQQRTDARAREWDGTPDTRGELLTGHYLDRAVHFLEQRENDLDPHTQRFIVHSRAAAEASVLWDRVGIGQTATEAIWRLATADRTTKLVFVEGLTETDTCAIKFNARAAILARAVAGLSPSLREEVISHHLARTWPTEAVPASLVAKARLGAELRAADLDALLRAIAATTDEDDLSAFGTALNALTGGILADQAENAPHKLLSMIQTAGSPRQLEVLANALGAMAGTLPAREAKQLLEPLLSTMAATSRHFRPELLASALASCAARLPQDRAEDALALFLNVIATTSDSDQLEAMRAGLAALTSRLTQEQSSRALTPILNAITASGRSSRRETLGSGLAHLAVRLPPEEAEQALEDLLHAVSDTIPDGRPTNPLVPALEALAAMLAPGRAHHLLARRIETASTISDIHEWWTLEAALLGMGPRLTTEQASEVLEPLSSLIATTAKPYFLKGLYEGLAVLPAQLNAVQAQRALPPLLHVIAGLTDPYDLQRWIVVLANSRAKLTSRQAE